MPIHQVKPVGHMHAPPKEPVSFQNTLCGCCDDCNVCLMGSWCLPLLWYDTYQRVHSEGGANYPGFYATCCEFLCIPPSANAALRGAIRQKYGMMSAEADSENSDGCASWCCLPLAVCQQAREVKQRSRLVVD